jgi:hypothetical protein
MSCRPSRSRSETASTFQPTPDGFRSTLTAPAADIRYTRTVPDVEATAKSIQPSLSKLPAATPWDPPGAGRDSR